MSTQAQNLTDIVDSLEETGDGDTVSVGRIVREFRGRGFGPLLLVPALVTLLPTGGIPGVPLVTATLIILISGQLLLGRKEPWVPRRLASLSTNRQRFTTLIDKAKPLTRRVDRVLKPRLTGFTSPLAARFIAALNISLAITLVPLNAIPFAPAIPSAILVSLSLGLAARDGAFIILGLVGTTLAPLVLLV